MQRAELRTAMVKEWSPVDLESSRAVGRPEIFRKLLQGQLKQAVTAVCRLPLDRIATLTPRLGAAPDPVVAQTDHFVICFPAVPVLVQGLS